MSRQFHCEDCDLIMLDVMSNFHQQHKMHSEFYGVEYIECKECIQSKEERK